MTSERQRHSALDSVALLEDGAQVLAEHGRSTLAAVLLHLAAGKSLEQSLSTGRGFQGAARKRRRDDALLALARHFGRQSVNDTAGRIAELVRRYASAGWKADSAAGRRPEFERGFAYDFLKVSRPLGDERIRQLLRDRW